MSSTNVARRLGIGLGASLVAFGLGMDLLPIRGDPGIGERQLAMAGVGAVLVALALAWGPLGLGGRLERLLRWLLRRHPRAFGLSLGCGAAILVLGAAELGLLVYQEYVAEPLAGPKYQLTGSLFASEPRLGYAQLPDRCARHSFVYDGSPVFDVAYNTDETGNRRSVYEAPVRDRYLAFLGCSFVFGFGLEDAETLPSLAAARAPHHRPYNYGTFRYGPNQLLRLVRSGRLEHELRESEGDVVYVLIDCHVHRAIGQVNLGNWAEIGENPCYRFGEGDALVDEGTFGERFPVRFWLARQLSWSRLALVADPMFPMRPGDDDVRVAARMIDEIGREVRARLPGARFRVLVHPDPTRGLLGDGPYTGAIVAELEARSVPVLDYRGLYDVDDPRHTIRADGHPSAQANAEIADRLVRDLGIGEPGQPRIDR